VFAICLNVANNSIAIYYRGVGLQLMQTAIVEKVVFLASTRHDLIKLLQLNVAQIVNRVKYYYSLE